MFTTTALLFLLQLPLPTVPLPSGFPEDGERRYAL